MTPSEQKEHREIVKQAIKEWMNERLAELGWFSLKTAGAFIVAASAYMYFSSHGFTK